MSDQFPPFVSPPESEDTSAVRIHFYNEDIAFELSDPDVIRSWITKVIQAEGHRLISLNIIFCSDTFLHQINVDYLQHDTLTDIITFPYNEAPLIEGEIFISIDRITENAAGLNIPFADELHRVLIHGVLHLCGYGDKSAEEKTQMTAKENEALALLGDLS